MTSERIDENKGTFGVRRGAESFGVEPRPKVEPTLLRELRSAEPLKSMTLEELKRLATEMLVPSEVRLRCISSLT